ncbi:TetR family transcriptional regulator [Spirillospora sp. CA-294931]|uniref:TetR family transcriptional regulator n=1 Tax=Spirillospora sp. CA-294931 TaxID=3240042 RepID=UPI003D8F2B0B
MSSNEEPQGLRELKKSHTRQALTDAALTLFEKQGYEETTVEQIAASVPVSRRTFHRYFGSKEEVVLAHEDRVFDELLDAFESRPAGESALTALRHALVGLLTTDEGIGDFGRTQRVQMLIFSNPSLLAANTYRYHRREQELARCVALRAGLDPGSRDLRPRLIAAQSMSALRVALTEWITGTDLAVSECVNLLNEALDLTATGLDLPAPTS